MGKYITKTRAVTLDNQKMDIKTAFLRSVHRLKSKYYEYDYHENKAEHDTLSGTKVINDINWTETDF